MKNEIKTRNVVDMRDGSQVSLEELTPAQRRALEKNMKERLSRGFSELYSANPQLLRKM